jgi:tetratricopeptide (TPR) repeat protein
MKRLLKAGFICCGLLMTVLASSAMAQNHAAAVAREAESLRAIAREPGRPVALWLADGAPFVEHRDLFDEAFAACRQALRAVPSADNVRVNLGGLYLWRDAFHPDESGNFEKAVDQFLIVLSGDPANEKTLAYLGTWEVLTRVAPEMGHKGMVDIQSALRRTLNSSTGAANIRALARVTFFDGSMIEARTAAEALTEIAPEPSSWLLLGSVEFRMGHGEKALTAFQTALKTAHTPEEIAIARLGLAESHKSLGHTQAADDMLAQAMAPLSQPALEHAARSAGLETPSELKWAIGKAYAGAGDIGKASEFLGVEGVNWLSSEAAMDKNSEGVRLFAAHDLKGASKAFAAAVQLIPMESVYWRNAAVVSFEMERYQESLMAFRRAAALEPLDNDRIFGLAMSYAVLGDYRNARTTFEKAAHDFPEKKTYAYWSVDIAYAMGGWSEAQAEWSRLVREGGAVPEEDFYDLFIHLRGGFTDIAGRAEKRGARYQSLRHESVLYHILGEGLKRNLLSREGREQIRTERAATLNKIIDNYRRLPLKPVVASDVQDLVLRAQPFLDSALDSYDSRRRAVDLYQQVIEAAPWWPEGHYTLALLACREPSMYAYGELSNPDSGWVAGREMNAYLALVPEGPDAQRARKILEGCRR